MIETELRKAITKAIKTGWISTGEFYTDVAVEEVYKLITNKLRLCDGSVSFKQGLAGAVEEASKHLMKPKCVRDGKVKRNER